VVVLVVAAAAAGGAVLWSADDEAQAHGSTQVPASRIYACRFEQPDGSMCAQAWAANAQALYDWMEVSIGDVAGHHQERIPDGKLCSAGRDKYAAFDRPGNWPLTHLQPGASGRYDIVFTSTAPHATAYFRLLLTRPGFDARTDTLRWSDLSQVYDSGPLPAAPTNRFSVALPARSEPAILYTIWQRSDSPEAFYACSDITIGGSGSTSPTTSTPPSTSPTTGPATTTPPPSGHDHQATTTTVAPPGGDHGDGHGDGPGGGGGGDGHDGGGSAVPSGAEPFSPVAGIKATATTTASWDHGRCVEIRVDNTSARTLSWEVHYAPEGDIATLWNATDEAQHHQGHEGHVAFIGEDWNERLPAGQWTTFGMCVDT